jgi:hypothetical protein
LDIFEKTVDWLSRYDHTNQMVIVMAAGAAAGVLIVVAIVAAVIP